MSDLQRYLQQLEPDAAGGVVPTTRLPALHPSATSAVGGGRNGRIAIDVAASAPQACDYVVGFARFVAQLTGAEEVVLDVQGTAVVASVRRDAAATAVEEEQGVLLRRVEAAVESDFVLRVEVRLPLPVLDVRSFV